MMSSKILSGVEGQINRYKNLVIHHYVANILDQSAQFIRVIDIVEETFGLPLFREQS